MIAKSKLNLFERTVYKAHLKSCSKIVALKQIVDKKGKNNIFTVPNMREFRFLMKYRHKNLLECIGMVSYDRPQAFGPEVHEYMVLEYMDHDLAGLMQHYPDKSLYQVEHIKCIAKQMLEGMEYMHSMGVMHRDLKVGNLLLNNKGELKIADFGFAREKEVYEERGYTNRVCTIWYRPLEVLLGQLHYSYEIDMWGAGCIIAEMFLKYPIFHTSRGRDTEQIKRIFSICGHPTDEDWDMYRHMDHSWSKMWLRPKQKFARRLESYLTEKAVTPMTPMAIDLISKLLSYNPNARPTVKEALQHPFFTEELPAACLPEELPAIDGSWHEYECKERIKQQKSGRKGDTNYLQSGAKAKAAVADPAPAAPEQEEAPAAAENEIDGRCVWDEARETWWDSITESLWDVDRWVPLQEYDRRRYLTDVSHKSSSQQEDPYRGREFDRDARVDSRDPHRHGAGAHHREVAPTSNTPYRSYERSHHPTGSYVDQSRGYGTEPRRGHFSYGQHGMPGNERTPYRGDQGRGRYGYDHSAPRSSGYSRHANYHDYPLSPTRDNRQGDRPPTIDTRTIDARSGDRPPSSGHYRESGHSQEQTGWDDGWGRGSARPGGTIKRSRESSADMYSIPDPRSAPGSHSRESKTPLQHSPTSAERNNNGFRGSDYSIPIHRANSRDLSSAPIHDDRTARRPDEFQHRSRPHSLDQRLGISERHQSFSGYENRVERHRSRSGDRDGRDKQESPTRRISPRKLFSRSRSRSPVRRTSGNVSRSRSRSQSKSRSSRSVDHSQSRGSESPSSRRDSRSSQGSSASKESPGGSPPNPPSEPSKSPSKRPREDEVEESNGRHEAKRHRSETATSSPSKRPIITPKNGGTSLDHEIATSAPPVGGSHADNQFADSPQRDSQRGQSIPSQEIVGKLNQEEPVTGHATHSTTLDDTLQHLPTEEPPIHHDESGLDDKPVVLKTFGSDSNAEIWALGKGFYASTHQYTQRLSELAKEEHRQEQRLTGSNSLSEPRQVARFCPDQHRLLDPILDIPWIEQQQLISRSV
ncbi:hypothetical protein DFS34DRAFT_496832 [Phlyctochytrium arcticum]|nr:hypothetical protein DFS34DRAFT_496832 [Phlyctochytrium arcticum]